MLDPNRTLPPGLTDPKFERFIGCRLDDRFESIADRLFRHYIDLCRVAQDRGLMLLSWEYARAAAHWRGVAEDRRNGVLVSGVELIEEGA